MAEMDQWLKTTAELFKQQNLSNKHQMFSQLEISPLAVEGDSSRPESWRSTGRIFYNINSFQNETIDEEFLKSPGCGLCIKGEWPSKLNSKQLFIYLESTPVLTSFKKALVVEKECAQLNVGLDPFSLGLWKSKLYKSEIEPEIFQAALEQGAKIFRLTSQPYAMAGATDTQQLATLLSSVVQLVDDFEGQQSRQEIFSSLSFELTLRPHLFGGVAKVRALKTLIERLAEVFEVPHLQVPIYVAPSARYLATREPWNNILRLTAIAAAAKMSGADGFVAFPYDLFEKKEDQGFRTSRNISEVLELESFLGQVSDPIYGSYTLSQIEDQLVQKAWELFVEIENKEGITSALRSGWLLDQVEVEADRQQECFRKGLLSLTGVNDYPLSRSLSDENPLPIEDHCLDLEDWWMTQYSEGSAEKLCDVARFIPQSLARIFENWQFRADRLRLTKGLNLKVPVLVEKGLEGSAKFKGLKNILSMAGLLLEVCEQVPEGPSKVVAVVAADPEGDFVKDVLSQFSQRKVGLKIWVGVKQVSGFDESLDIQSDTQLFYENLFSVLEDR